MNKTELTTEPIVELSHVSFTYHGRCVIKDVNLNIFKDDFMAMIGPNGGGKTTLLKLMLGLLKPDKGTIRVMGKETGKASHHIGYVPQETDINLRFPVTTLDVVLMGTLAPGKRGPQNASRNRRDALAALEKLEMEGFADHKIGALSGGQRRRVLIARGMVSKPRLLLLDEPAASIDPKGQADFFNLLDTLNKSIAILIVSHDLMVVSTHVKSVACVNKRLHFHRRAEITREMLETMYPRTDEAVCPVELIAHGLPHRVLTSHRALKSHRIEK